MTSQHKIIDGDGHVVEDIASIGKYMPQEYVGKSFSDIARKNPFPPIDHLHTANRHFTPKGAFANVGREGWELFLDEVGIGTTVLYTSAGLAFGKIVSRDWAIELARAYNNWTHDTYLSKSSRVQSDGPDPLARTRRSRVELRRIVRDLGFSRRDAAVDGREHAASRVREILADLWRSRAFGLRASRFTAGRTKLADGRLEPLRVANALGHPMGQMIGFAGYIFNGIFDKFPGLRIGFMEAGSRLAARPAWSASAAPGKATCNTIRADAF